MGGGQNCIWGEFIPVPDCAGEEGVASVVCAAAEALVFEAVVAASCTHIVQELCESRGGRPGWPSWAGRPNEPSGFRGRKAILNHASALVSACP